MGKKKNASLVRQVGERIRAIRLDRGMTQAEVAEAADCDPQTIQRAETGRYGLSLGRLEAVARGLGVPVSDLFSGVDAEVPPAPWSVEEAAVVSAWRHVPEERRDLLLRTVKEFSR